ncbi:MAG: hypothetical protein HYX24_06405 [Candidatus Aenigmarchaeota archaeon]|nr:hypothetical protein [Candidatus Aenigmarchaeota archaeon]
MDSKLVAVAAALIVVVAAAIFVAMQRPPEVNQGPAETPVQQAPVTGEITEDQAAQAAEQELDSSLQEISTGELEQALLSQ